MNPRSTRTTDMALLRNPRQTPPDGYRYVQRETGARFTAMNHIDLTDMVIKHRLHHGFQPTDCETVWLEIQRQLCEFMFPEICAAENGENYQPIVDQSRSLNPDKVVDFSRSMYAFIESGGEMVPKSESERRAAICRGCPLNRPSACICTPLFKLLDSFVSTTRREPGMEICGACGCANSVSILLPLATIHHDKNLRFPDFCWQSGTHPDGKAQAT